MALRGGAFAAGVCAVLAAAGWAGAPAEKNARTAAVVEIDLKGVIEPVTAEYVERGIDHANAIGAAAVLLTLSTPGGLDTSMREIIQSIISSHVPVVTYVYPSGSRAASAGFFVLLAGDVAAMAPGTNTGAAHPVLMNGADLPKTLGAKIENDAAAYIRSIAEKRGRNEKLAEAGVRESKSYTENEALQNHLIDMVANNPSELLRQLDGKTIKRFDGSSQTLQLTDAVQERYDMTTRQQFLSRLADPNIAFILGAIGALCLYVEFTHPGMVLPGGLGAIAMVLALYGFHLLPINYTGVILILVGVVLFALEVKVASHGILTAGGVIAMVVGALILVQSPLPGAQIHLSTALGVAIPVAIISGILVRFAVAARRRKAVTGAEGMIDAVGVARTDIAPHGKVLVHGELWEARAAASVASGSRVRVRGVEGLTLVVEAEPEPPVDNPPANVHS